MQGSKLCVFCVVETNGDRKHLRIFQPCVGFRCDPVRNTRVRLHVSVFLRKRLGSQVCVVLSKPNMQAESRRQRQRHWHLQREADLFIREMVNETSHSNSRWLCYSCILPWDEQSTAHTSNSVLPSETRKKVFCAAQVKCSFFGKQIYLLQLHKAEVFEKHRRVFSLLQGRSQKPGFCRGYSRP